MNAHIIKKKDNYYIAMEWVERGERQTKTISVRKYLGLNRRAKKKEANVVLHKIMEEQRQGVFIEPTSVLLGEVVSEWLKCHKYSIKPTTYSSYRALIDNHIIPELGNIQLSKLRPSQIKAFYSKKLVGGRADGKPGGLSNRSIRYIHAILGAALDSAVEDELIPRNVVRSVTPPAPVKPEIKYWEWEKAKQFLESTKQDRYYLFYLIALSTGMGRGEILGLRWQDINWKKQTLSIRQSVVNTDGGPIIQPSVKTKNRSRTIDISEGLTLQLRAHKKNQAEEMLALGNKNPHNLVLLNQNDNYVRPRNMDRSMERAIIRFNKTYKERYKIENHLPKISSHGLRHTYATHLLEEGVHPKVVSERLGHANIQITLDTYSHVTPRLQKEAALLTEDLT